MLQAKEKALSGVRAQIAERDQQIAHKDALIAQLMQQSAKAGQLANGCPAPEVQKSAGSGGGGGGGIFSKLRTNLARGSVRAPLLLCGALCGMPVWRLTCRLCSIMCNFSVCVCVQVYERVLLASDTVDACCAAPWRA